MNSSAPAVAKATLGALWDPVSWRATLHALLGLMVAAVLVVLVVLWGAAVVALIEGPTGPPVLTVIYVVTAVTGPVLLLWLLGALSAVQRARFRAVLGVEIPQPPPVTGQWPLRLASAWRAAATWRQAGYHLLALIIGPVGGVTVAVCWTAILAVAIYPGQPARRPPRPAGGGGGLVSGRSVGSEGSGPRRHVTARVLLGPSRSEELTLRVEALARSRAEIVAATDAERRRIERDLHDGAQQQLLSLAMNLGMALATLDDVPGPARRAIEQAHEQAVEAIAGLRELVRGLHPAVLNDRGLDAALSGIVARDPLPVRLRVDVATRCAPSLEAIAYVTVSEALTNITRHAQATHARVGVERADGQLRIIITDNGRGGASLNTDGSGLRGLAQRAAAIDGTLHVHSPVGGPTTITMELPCE